MTPGTPKTSSGSTPSESSGIGCCTPSTVTLRAYDDIGLPEDTEETYIFTLQEEDCTYILTGGTGTTGTLIYNDTALQWEASLSGSRGSVDGSLADATGCDPIDWEWFTENNTGFYTLLESY